MGDHVKLILTDKFSCGRSQIKMLLKFKFEEDILLVYDKIIQMSNFFNPMVISIKKSIYDETFKYRTLSVIDILSTICRCPLFREEKK